MDESILLFLHERTSPALDAFFLLSHTLGSIGFCATLVALAVIVARLRGAEREALLWAGLGLSTLALELTLKHVVMRPRPALWTAAIVGTSSSFPSGHAMAAATLYPLLARAAARRWPAWRLRFWGAALLTALSIGLGRLYLGVHWPSDVLAGWTLGAFQTWLALRWLERTEAQACRAS